MLRLNIIIIINIYNCINAGTQKTCPYVLHEKRLLSSHNREIHMQRKMLIATHNINTKTLFF